jgi:hypothetical protein
VIIPLAAKETVGVTRRIAALQPDLVHAPPAERVAFDEEPLVDGDPAAGTDVELGHPRADPPRRCGGPLTQAVDAAKSADVAVVFASLRGSEGSDPASIGVPGQQGRYSEALDVGYRWPALTLVRQRDRIRAHGRWI